MSSLLEFGLPAAPVLHADEELDDWLEITASLYASNKENLLDEIARLLKVGRASGEGADDNALKVQLAAALGQRLNSNDAARIADAHSYCPLCIVDDLRAGGLPYFRRVWAHSLCTMCSVHSVPMFVWPFANEKGEKSFPRWVIDNYVQGRPLTPRRGKITAPDRYGLQLSRCREVQRWALRCSEEFFVIGQQLAFEQGLIREERHNLIGVIAGDDRRSFRNAFDDLCSAYVGQFAADWRESHPVSNFNYLGPAWLFKQPSRRKIDELSLINPLGFIVAPAERRSVIALVMRTLMGFSADIVCDSLGAITDTGATSLSCDLYRLSTAAKDFVLRRSNRWPPFVKVGVRRAVNRA